MKKTILYFLLFASLIIIGCKEEKSLNSSADSNSSSSADSNSSSSADSNSSSSADSNSSSSAISNLGNPINSFGYYGEKVKFANNYIVGAWEDSKNSYFFYSNGTGRLDPINLNAGIGLLYGINENGNTLSFEIGFLDENSSFPKPYNPIEIKCVNFETNCCVYITEKNEKNQLCKK